MTFLDVAYAGAGLFVFVGMLVIVAGYTENRRDAALDDRIARRHRLGGVR